MNKLYKEEDYPMIQFLQSPHIEFHPLNKISLPEFFYCFHGYCHKNNMNAIKKNYGPLFKQFDNIQFTKKYIYGLDIPNKSQFQDIGL